MILLLVIVAVLLLGLAAAAVVLRSGVSGVPDPVTTESFVPLPRGVVQPEQVTELRFDQAIRGYRMSQVDDVLDQLTEELRDRDAEVARLRAELAAVPVDFTGGRHLPDPDEVTAAEPTGTDESSTAESSTAEGVATGESGRGDL